MCFEQSVQNTGGEICVTAQSHRTPLETPFQLHLPFRVLRLVLTLLLNEAKLRGQGREQSEPWLQTHVPPEGIEALGLHNELPRAVLLSRGEELWF